MQSCLPNEVRPEDDGEEVSGRGKGTSRWKEEQSRMLNLQGSILSL